MNNVSCFGAFSLTSNNTNDFYSKSKNDNITLPRTFSQCNLRSVLDV